MCAAAHGWVGLGRIVYVHSSAQLVAWLTEWGVAPPPVAALPIPQVAPHVPSSVRSPDSTSRSGSCTAATIRRHEVATGRPCAKPRTYPQPFHDAEAVRGLLCFPQERVEIQVARDERAADPTGR